MFTLQAAMAALTTGPIPEKVPPIPFERLSVRQRKLLALCAEGKTLVEIGDAMNVSRQRAWQMLEAIKGRASELMDEYGLSEAALIETYLKPALNAEETEFAKFEGKITDSRNVVAWGPRLQALELAARIKGMYAAPKQAIGVQAGDVSIEIVTVG